MRYQLEKLLLLFKELKSVVSKEEEKAIWHGKKEVTKLRGENVGFMCRKL